MVFYFYAEAKFEAIGVRNEPKWRPLGSQGAIKSDLVIWAGAFLEPFGAPEVTFGAPGVTFGVPGLTLGALGLFGAVRIAMGERSAEGRMMEN